MSNLIDIHLPDIVIGVESWLRSDYGYGNFHTGLDSLYRRNRIGTVGHGVFILVKEEFVSYEKVKDEKHEILGVRLISKDNRQLDIFGVYRPGKGGADADAELFDKIISYVGNGTNSNIIVAGDLIYQMSIAMEMCVIGSMTNKW